MKNTKQPTAEPFVMMTRTIFDSTEYRGLRPIDRDVLWLIIRRHNGVNNGGISLGARDVATWYGYGKTAANDALRRLEKVKLISAVRKGHLVPIAGRRNVATVWRLNFIKDGTTND
jgi:hypothetical protein